MKFTVVIEDWLRGNCNLAMLLNLEGKRCCLGFAAKQCGVSDDNLFGVGTPEGIPASGKVALNGILIQKSEPSGRYVDNEFSEAAWRINDDESINDEQRMAQLQALAQQHGHEFVFVHKQEA